MVNDTEPRYRLVDANGNVVGSLFAESDGTIKVQEGTSGNDNELSFTTQGALSVEQLTTGGVLQSKLVAEKSSGTTSNAVTFNFTGLDASNYYLEFDGVTTNGASEVLLTVNGVSSSGNGSYAYFDESGTKVSPTDNIRLVNAGNFVRPEGTVTVRAAGNRTAVSSQLGFGEPQNLTGFAQAGGYISADVLSSIQIEITGGVTTATVRLWEGVR